MVDFTYYTPTEVAFGKNAEEQIAQLVKKYGGTKVLVHYGGKSAVRSGLIDKVCSQLQAEGIPFVQLGGVVPNPRVSLVRKGIELCRQEGVDHETDRYPSDGEWGDETSCQRLWTNAGPSPRQLLLHW